MLINKAYKFRIYPNDNQKEIINKTFGCTRLIYNYYLSKKQDSYKLNGKSLTLYETISDLKNLYMEKPFLREIDSMAIRCSLFDLDNAYNKFFKEHKGFPKYKSKFDKNSYRTNYIKNTYKNKIYENIKADLKNKLITLPKLKEIKIRGYRTLDDINGRIINACVLKEKNNKYYVTVLYEQEVNNESIKLNTVIGIDLGIKDLMITSDYEKYHNEKVINKYEKRIKRYQKLLSKKQKQSNNYFKLKQKLARLYSKLKNARKYIIHQITKKITDENDIIVTEKLKVKNMLQNHKIAKALSNASLSEIIRQLEYKTKWKGKKMYKVDTFYPSSQICSKCGYQNKVVLDLNVRNYECPNCKSYLDRDYNAAENIMFEGIKMYMREIMI